MRETTDADLKIYYSSNVKHKSDKEAQLTKDLLNDSSANTISLIAYSR